MSTTNAQTNRHIARNNAAVARCAGAALTGDGMAVARAQRPDAMTMTILLAAFMVLTLAKAAAALTMGDTAYGAALSLMQQGSVVDQAGAWLLQADALTSVLVDTLR